MRIASDRLYFPPVLLGGRNGAATLDGLGGGPRYVFGMAPCPVFGGVASEGPGAEAGAFFGSEAWEGVAAFSGVMILCTITCATVVTASCTWAGEGTWAGAGVIC